MKLSAITALLAVGLFMDGSLAFQSQSSLSTQQQRSSSLYGYVPSGFTPEQYKKFKAQEDKKKQKKKNLGSMGPKGFQSRSFQSFQEALEKGEATHLMPVLDAEKRIKSGELKREDIPVSRAFLRRVNHDLIVQFDAFILTYPTVCLSTQYMQRGGKWDNSDVKGAKKSRWLKSDKDYSEGGFRKEQSKSIFGYGEGLDWTGKNARSGPSESIPGAAPKFGKNYKAPTISQLKGTDDKPKKKFFGMF